MTTSKQFILVTAIALTIGPVFADSSSQSAPSSGHADSIRPFRVTFPEEALSDLRHRLVATRWPEKETVNDESQGVQLATMKQLVRYWSRNYDWLKIEAKLNSYPQFVSEIFNKLTKGGHFAAWEQPAAFTEELRAAFNPLRSNSVTALKD